MQLTLVKTLESSIIPLSWSEQIPHNVNEVAGRMGEVHALVAATKTFLRSTVTTPNEDKPIKRAWQRRWLRVIASPSQSVDLFIVAHRFCIIRRQCENSKPPKVHFLKITHGTCAWKIYDTWKAPPDVHVTRKFIKNLFPISFDMLFCILINRPDSSAISPPCSSFQSVSSATGFH